MSGERTETGGGQASLTTSMITDDEESGTASVSRPRLLSRRQTSVIDLAKCLSGSGDGADVQRMPVDANLTSVSFLLCLFDNIVGPKIVHHWLVQDAGRGAQHADEQLLKYVAVHTLNGELYQDKLHSNLKYRLYLIQEIDRAIFSVFFDASTITSANASSATSNPMPYHSGSLTPFSASHHSHRKRSNNTLCYCFNN